MKLLRISEQLRSLANCLPRKKLLKSTICQVHLVRAVTPSGSTPPLFLYNYSLDCHCQAVGQESKFSSVE